MNRVNIVCEYYSQKLILRISYIKLYFLSFLLLFIFFSSTLLHATESISQNPKRLSTENEVSKVAPLTQFQNNSESITNKALLASETFLVDVVVNTQQITGIHRVEKLIDGRIALPIDVWQLTRLIPKQERVELIDNNQGYIIDLIKGLNYSLDIKKLVLEINAPANAFQDNLISTPIKTLNAPRLSAPGVLLNYNLSGTSSDDHKTRYAGLVEGIAFGSWGAAVAGAVLRADEFKTETVRTESYWKKDLPNQMQTLTIGDTIDVGSDWSRPARFAGIQWGRDFALQPDYISYPMPSLSGSAALPSTVDVLVNNQNIQMHNVNSGPFDLKNIPVVTGAGELNLIVRNLLGEQTLITKSYYASADLLEENTTDFSVQAGFFRENYGVTSNDYGELFSSINWRQGLSDKTTFSGRLEIQENRQALGGTVDQVLGDFAVVRVGGGVSKDKEHQGGRYLAALERVSSGYGGSVRWEYFDQNYHQFSSIEGEINPRRKITAGYGLPIFRNMTAGVNYISQSYWNNDLFSLLSASLSISLPENILLHTYASKNFDSDQGWSGGVSLTIPLDKQRSFAVNTQKDQQGTSTAAEFTQSAPSGPGIGWSIRASDNPNQQLRTHLTLNTTKGQFIAEAEKGEDTNLSLRVAANGTLGWFNQMAFATRDIGHQSFAVVKVADFEGIPVYRNNQLAGYTNSRGLAFVPNLLPYQKNKISLDPVDLPLNAEIHGIEMHPQPYARSGVFVDLPIRRSNQAFIQIMQEDKTPVPLGARVKLLGQDAEYMVGKRGEAYLINLAQSNHVTVTWDDQKCEFDMYLDSQHSLEVENASYICIRAESSVH